ncbi:hypothetical protein JQN72_07855 [Phycicoccus sp. CSK15P-2]|uniref:hypothetical protein n=1 Tax=Phycicoccus sp. CSK15P-2 TaxID=2807627 RepID=UPI00195226CC|nr:hypothetical protein [Phycicoccus sp. CSK15P-2]MBM6404157.1 hypothetical protein [Phycicoccus sp. CSK15P-2]
MSADPVMDRTLSSALGPSVTAEKARRVFNLVSEHETLTSLHRGPVEQTERPSVPEEQPPGVRSLDGQRRRHDEGEEGSATLADDLTAQEQGLDAWWDALCSNDHETLLPHLSRTFQELNLPVSPVSVVHDTVELAVLTPGEHLLPRDTVGLVGGTLSIRMSTAAHRAWLHRQVVAGLTLSAARHALAAAPGLRVARVHAIHAEHRGEVADLSVLGVVDIDRDRLETADLDQDAESLVLHDGAVRHWDTEGEHGTLRPRPLDDLPALAPFLARLCRARGRILA